MNIERMEALAKHLRKLDSTSFYMGDFIEGEGWPSDTDHNKTVTELSCGTRCCVAGWACVLFAPDWVPGEKWAFDDKASELLGLNKEQEQSLFFEWRQDGVNRPDIKADEIDRMVFDYKNPGLPL